MKFLYRLILLTLLLSYSPVGLGATAYNFSDELSKADDRYQQCLDQLSTKARRVLSSGDSIGVKNWPRLTQKKVAECLDARRDRDDIHDMINLARDLTGLGDSQMKEGGKGAIENEANELSYLLVSGTRKLNDVYQMGDVALWHNFLIKVGTKRGGYCYQWTEELLKLLPQKKMDFFERHWGVHNEKRVTENNAVIFTLRGRPVGEGIVYDPWRGKGRPFWRKVMTDNQDWTERFSEELILCCSPL